MLCRKGKFYDRMMKMHWCFQHISVLDSLYTVRNEYTIRIVAIETDDYQRDDNPT